MHYYQFNIGDYNKHTMHLSPIEDITYRRLLDMYYDTEAPIPTDIPWVSRRLRIESGIVKAILNEFFEYTENGYINGRADAEIASYHGFLEKQKLNGIKGGRPKKTHGIPKPNPSLTQNNPKQETLNTNHKPLKELADKSAIATRLSEDWQLPDEWAIWAKQERPDLNPNKVADSFKDYWIAQPSSKGKKTNWLATWRNWVRTQKPDIENKVYEAPWVKQNREWFDEATGRKPEKDFVDMETNLTRIAK
jgi:uncharacterized protein YdaU (DUF1376 family)